MMMWPRFTRRYDHRLNTDTAVFRLLIKTEQNLEIVDGRFKFFDLHVGGQNTLGLVVVMGIYNWFYSGDPTTGTPVWPRLLR